MDSITALRNRFTQDDLREVRKIKLENQKFNSKTDAVKNFLVKLRTETNKAYSPPEVVVAPAGGSDADTRRFGRETSTRDCPSDVRKTKKQTNKALLC